MEMEIEIDLRIDESFEFEELINQAIIKTAENEGINCPLEVSVSVVGNEEIQTLNKQYRNIDSVTDVLSFPLLEQDELESGLMQKQLLPIGDIILCYPRALEQAEEYEHSIEREVAFLAIHSTLHLLGYDHLNSHEEEIMIGKQKEVLKLMNLI